MKKKLRYKLKNAVLVILAWAAAIAMFISGIGIDTEDAAAFMDMVKVYLIASIYLGLFIAANSRQLEPADKEESDSGKEEQKKSA